VIYGCANQAGEDNRNVARMALLLAGLPVSVPGATINRLCGSGMDAVGTAARAIKAGERELMIAGGVESMSRAPFVMPKAESAFSAQQRRLRHDDRLALRQQADEGAVRHRLDARDGRERRRRLRHRARGAGPHGAGARSKAVAAQKAGFFDAEITPVTIPQKKGDPSSSQRTSIRARPALEALAKLKGVVKPDGSVTAGNASGVNDGACALLLAERGRAARHGLTPRARVVGMADAGVAPRIMGIGPAPATRKVLALTGLTLAQMDVIELNEAFAAQGLAVLRDLGLADDDARVNPNGGAIALGHPLGMPAARGW
jgi:acetyl-CoA acetyltransferase family protein